MSDEERARAIEFVVMFIALGALGIGLLSMLIGWVVRAWNRMRNSVNHSQLTPLAESTQTDRQTQTDEQTDLVSVGNQWLNRLEVDRTKTTLIELMVYSGWQVGEIRAVLKGDNGVLGTEIEAARKRLGMAPDPPRMLHIRDQAGERLIPMETDS